MKLFYATILASCLAGLFLGCHACQSGEGNQAADGDTDTADSPEAEQDTFARWPACEAGAATQDITFIHVNDIHAAYTPDPLFDNESAVARMVGYYRQALARNPYTVFTNGGDDHEKGSVAEQLSGGYATSEVIKAMGFDVRVIGNHDWAWGEDELIGHTQDDRALVLCGNTTYSGLKPYAAREFATLKVGCLTVGFFGLHPRPYDENNESYDGPYYKDNPDWETSYNWTTKAADIVARHRSEVDLMVMVSHLGQGEDRTIAELVDGIDVILGGHSHTIMADTEVINDTVIIQCGASAGFVGDLTLSVDLQAKDITDISYDLVMNFPGTLPLDEPTNKAVLDIMNHYAPEANTEVAWLKAGCSKVCMAQILGRAALSMHQVDAAAVWLEIMWSTWASGGITPQDMLDAAKVERQPAGTPGWTSLYTVELTGADLAVLLNEAEADSDWVVTRPVEALDNARTYTLLLPKGPAFNPGRFFSVTFSGAPRFVSETWALWDAYGRDRSANCQYLDTDDPLEPCP